MKKKLMGITMLMIISVFAVGTMFGNPVKANNTYMIDPADIIDWNTDGNELSMCLSNGSECYAYKQEDCFTVKKRDYLPLKDIADVRVVKNGFYIIDSNGEECYIAKNEEK